MAGDLTGVRVIICCAGNRTRWKDYLGVPKQFAPINGVPLLFRTISQLRARGARDIYVTAFDKEFQNLDGATTVAPKYSVLPDTGTGYAAGFWNKEGRTAVLYGDVYWTHAAMDALASTPPKDLIWLGRYGPGKAQHCGELFGYSLPLDMQAKFTFAIQTVLLAKNRGETVRACSWEVYRYMHGIPLGDHRVSGDWVEIDDATDDWDTPEDYERWRSLFEASERGAAT